MDEMRPLTLRLMGVRMSEFRNEQDGGGGASRRQKTIDSFLSSAKVYKITSQENNPEGAKRTKKKSSKTVK